MAANPLNNDLNFPHFQPPPPPPPVPTPDHHPTVIVIVVISFSSLLFLGACLFSLWCLLWRHKKRKFVQKTEDIDVDEHRKVQEMVLPGPHGPKTMVLSVEDEVRVHDKVSKHEIDMVSSKGLHGAPKDGDVALEGYIPVINRHGKGPLRKAKADSRLSLEIKFGFPRGRYPKKHFTIPSSRAGTYSRIQRNPNA
ncbi:hypothetical protein Cgig2_013208 [Carnegiea gigantea]|uniref:Uncharacterized protein n=1 Tax=Carnegiea gigantea TaxID=171969 RepID=A0A9Q1QLP0_9CARY|nr:hypothetical protein Cgig2_020710 [Carnegiea gigantea]KAJ8446907.1 hypothetical protein Cgig2_013208 [Carnegiea gigantea]